MLIALLVIHILAHIDRNILIGFSPQITQELQLSNAQYGFLSGGVWVLSFGVMAIFMGTLADRYSRTRVVAAGIAIWSVCTAASGFAQSFEQLVLARLLVASGEAALVPAALSLLAELFTQHRRGTAIGLFFVGIPVGVGLSFLIAGSYGAAQGWRGTFVALGILGVAIALPASLLKESRGQAAGERERGAPFLAQVKAVLAVLAGNRALQLTLAGFVLIHLLFAGLSFAQLWLVRERGLDPAGIARTIGVLQLAFGTLGSVAGGMLGDRFARKFAGGHAAFMVLLVALCGPLMIAFRLAPAGSALFYIGMCAGAFLPLALYGPANAVIQGLVPAHMRSTVAGFNMLLINLFAIALGNFALGFVSDRLAQGGAATPLTTVLLAADLLAVASGLLFWLAARSMRKSGLAPVSRDPMAVAH
ncbi:MFS transporter [Ramlibacter solisilvae]